MGGRDGGVASSTVRVLGHVCWGLAQGAVLGLIALAQCFCSGGDWPCFRNAHGLRSACPCFVACKTVLPRVGPT